MPIDKRGETMYVIKGKSVFGAIARGVLTFYRRDEFVVNKIKVGDPQLEYKKYTDARDAALTELGELYERALSSIGEKDAQIFVIHQMIMTDDQYEGQIKDLILEQHFNADYAVACTARSFTKMLGEMDSEYMQARTMDVKDVSSRLLRHILNCAGNMPVLKGNSILCTGDLMPSETVLMDKSKITAFCTRTGSVNSHTAILAKTMNIPALVNVGGALTEELDGMDAILDGYSGTLYIQPDEATIRMIDGKEAVEGRKKELLHRLRGRRNITRDGHEIKVYANVGNLNEVQNAIENDSGGIGLFRSEFMYFDRTEFPNEELQFYNYRRVLEDMKGKEVVLAAFDIGADKRPDYLNTEYERNPAMGYRAIRVCLEQKDMFKTQLRAMYRASVYGRLSILLPMIIDVSELRRVKEIIHEVKEELISEGKPFSENVKLGVMIETPAAVMTSDILAKEADFFNIGTNDLEQFTLALDRQNSRYEQICPEHHLAVLRMIKIVCDNAHANGIEVGICGELGGDLSLTETFLELHVDMLSVTPSQVLPLRRTIRSISLSDRRQIHANLQKMLKY